MLYTYNFKDCTPGCDGRGVLCYDQPNRNRIAVATNNESGHQFFCNADVAKKPLTCNRMTWYHSNGTQVPTDEKCRAPCRRQEITGPTCNLCINTHWGFPKCKGKKQTIPLILPVSSNIKQCEVYQICTLCSYY